jgi:hypothetical protein
MREYFAKLGVRDLKVGELAESTPSKTLKWLQKHYQLKTLKKLDKG